MLEEHRTEYLLRTVASELKDVTRLFHLDPALWEEGHDPALTWRAWEEQGEYACCFALGDRQWERRCPVPREADERLCLLAEKRALKRLCKQTLYDLCKDVTGMTPPWGSLTGIRPTRLVYEAMEHGAALDAACAQVGAEFDVSAEKLALLRDIVTVQSQLLPPEDGAVDVYVGIPFCTTRCAYCSFLSGELGRGKLVEPYLAALFQEMEAGAQLLAESGRRLRAVYVGGGTPTALNADQLRRLLHLLMKRFPGAVEYTVEAGRPDTLTPEKLALIREAGVRRISINPQTMNDETLVRIGRAHTAQQTVDAYKMARQIGFGDINMDVIAALPGEDYTMFERTLDIIRDLAPDSLTVHTLAIKRSSKLHEQKYQQSIKDTADMVSLGREVAHRMGMRAYYLYRQKYMSENLENVGYSRPERICRYNIDNMEETTSVLALGAGGISKCVMRQEEKILRAPNIANIEQYIERVDEMVARKREAFAVKGKSLNTK